MAADDAPQTLADVVREVGEAARSDNELSVEDLLDKFDGRTFGPLLLVPGLLAASPLGAIPGVPTVMGLLLLLVAGQALLGRRHPWVPKPLRERAVSQEKTERAIEKLRPWAERVDRWVKPRLSFLVTGPARYVSGSLAVLLAVMMPPLELVPFAVFVPAIGVVLLGLAVTTKDGVLGVVSWLFTGGTVGLVVWWFFLK
ncbi:MAG: exopolysaccharide biosynthesis protein [Planctomycetota bacterium]